jgi:hypothetical protein
LQACPLQTILVTDWLISKKSSPLKLLSQMNRNLVGSIYGRSSIKISYFVMIRLQAWPLQTILVTDWLISKKSSPLKLLSQMNRKLVGSIYGRSSIKIAHLVPIHGYHRQFLFLIGWFLKKKSPLKRLGQMNRSLVGNILGKSSIKIAQLVLIHWKTLRHRPLLFLIGWILINLLLWKRFPKWTEIW